jgi:hypothetical protein
MKKIFALLAVATLLTATACTKEDNWPSGPRTEVPADLQGLWMYGNFSTTEYWSTDPSTYMGNALELAFAFKFNSDGTYVQYFTASSAQSGGVTYQQSVTHGTMEVNPVTKTIVTHAAKTHYKRTRNGHTIEERDLDKSEINKPTTYTYAPSTEANGTKALKLTLNSTSTLKFLQKQ